jgi:hypothetical protein
LQRQDRDFGGRFGNQVEAGFAFAARNQHRSIMQRRRGMARPPPGHRLNHQVKVPETAWTARPLRNVRSLRVRPRQARRRSPAVKLRADVVGPAIVGPQVVSIVPVALNIPVAVVDFREWLGGNSTPITQQRDG